jgi:hypothetical protein
MPDFGSLVGFYSVFSRERELASLQRRAADQAPDGIDLSFLWRVPDFLQFSHVGSDLSDGQSMCPLPFRTRSDDAPHLEALCPDDLS